MFGLQYGSTAPMSPLPDTNSMFGFGGVLLVLLAIISIVFIVLYVYMCFALMKTAQKLKVESNWLAFIPIANIYLKAKMAKMPVWPVYLYAPGLTLAIIGVISIIMRSTVTAIISLSLAFILLTTISVFIYIWEYKICEARGRPGWWALLPLVAMAFIPFKFIPFIGSLIYNMVAMAASVWAMVYWGILAWGR